MNLQSLVGLVCSLMSVAHYNNNTLPCKRVRDCYTCTLLKQTPPQFLEEYNRRIELPPYRDYPMLAFFGVAYDAMWAMAVGLHNAAVRVSNHNDTGCEHEPGDITPLEDFDYTNQKMGCIFKRAFEEIQFTGITVSDDSCTNCWYMCACM